MGKHEDDEEERACSSPQEGSETKLGRSSLEGDGPSIANAWMRVGGMS